MESSDSGSRTNAGRNGQQRRSNLPGAQGRFATSSRGASGTTGSANVGGTKRHSSAGPTGASSNKGAKTGAAASGRNRNAKRHRSGKGSGQWRHTSVRGMVLIAVVVLVLVLFVAWGVRGIMAMMQGPAQSGNESAQSGQLQTQSGDQTKTIQIGNGLSKTVVESCTQQDLMALTQVSSGIYPGTGATFAVTLNNVTNKQCSTSTDQFSLKITSGNQMIVDTGACSPQSGAGQSGGAQSGSGPAGLQPDSTPLLFGVGDSWTGNVTWDGRVYSNCQPGDVGGSGSYQAQILMDGQAMGQPIPFTVN